MEKVVVVSGIYTMSAKIFDHRLFLPEAFDKGRGKVGEVVRYHSVP